MTRKWRFDEPSIHALEMDIVFPNSVNVAGSFETETKAAQT